MNHMKKSLIISLISLFAINSNAQVSIDAKVSTGINGIYKLGMSTDFIDISSAFSYNLGISLSQNIWKKGKIVADILYFNKSSKVHWLFGISNNVPDYTIGFNYISVPVYLKIEAAKSFYIDMGYVNNIFLTYKIGAYDTVDENPYVGGIILGLEYNIIPKLNIGINAQTDIKPFSNQLIEPKLESEKNSYYNYSFMLSLSYRLFSKKK